MKRIEKYSSLAAKKKKLPPASFELMDELDVHPEATQRGTTTYLVFEKMVKEWVKEHKGKKPFIVDVGAGQGINVRNLEAKGFKVLAIEPFADSKKWGERSPDYAYSAEAPSNVADLIFNSYVLNVVPDDIARGIVRDIERILKPGGQALIITRGSKDNIENSIPVVHPEYGPLEWGPLEKISKSQGKNTYQKGYTFQSLSTLVEEEIPSAQISKYPGSNLKSVKLLVTK